MTDLREAIAQAIKDVMGPVFGSPEYLADPVKLARAEKRQMDGALAYADAVLAILPDAEALVKLLQDWQETGCPDCFADCAGANPPIIGCLPKRTASALANYRKGTGREG